MARKPRYANAEEFQAKIEAYIRECREKDDTFPDEAGMRLYLNLKQRMIEKLCEGADGEDQEKAEKAQAYKDALAYAKDCRESWLVRHMVTDNKAANGCMNALKQAANGGYIDRPIDSGTISVNLKVDGIGGLDKFK